MTPTHRILLILLFSLALIAAIGCSGKPTQTAAQPETIRDVAIIQAQRSTVPDYVEAVGTLRAARTALLSAQIIATVSIVHASEGQRVRRGDVLVVLDDAQQRAGLERAQAASAAAQQNIAAAEADSGLAQSTLARYQSLYEKKSVSPHEFDEVQARGKAAAARRDAAQAGQAQVRAAERQARAMLGYTRIRAPFDGVVTVKLVDPGALASPGVPLVTVEDTSMFRLEASLDEAQIGVAKPGSTTLVLLDSLGVELAGRVVQIVPAAHPASRSFTVKVELPSDPRLRSGIFGRVRFPRGEREAIVVPRTAVVERGQVQGVYVIGHNGEVAFRYVTLGKPVDDKVEVLSGLNGGEHLVAEHRGRELSGKRVVN